MSGRGLIWPVRSASTYQKKLLETPCDSWPRRSASTIPRALTAASASGIPSDANAPATNCSRRSASTRTRSIVSAAAMVPSPVPISAPTCALPGRFRLQRLGVAEAALEDRPQRLGVREQVVGHRDIFARRRPRRVAAEQLGIVARQELAPVGLREPDPDDAVLRDHRIHVAVHGGVGSAEVRLHLDALDGCEEPLVALERRRWDGHAVTAQRTRGIPATLPAMDISIFANPDAWVALLTLTVARDRAGHRQHRVHLDPRRQAARRPAGEGATRRPRCRADHAHRPAVLALVHHRADRSRSSTSAATRSPAAISCCSSVACSCSRRPRSRSTRCSRARRATRRRRDRDSFAGTIIQIGLLDIVFSLDSVITAVGLAEDLIVMVAGGRDRGPRHARLVARDQQLRAPPPDREDAGALVPAADRHVAGRRRLGPPHRQGIHLLRDGLLGLRRAAEPAASARIRRADRAAPDVRQGRGSRPADVRRPSGARRPTADRPRGGRRAHDRGRRRARICGCCSAASTRGSTRARPATTSRGRATGSGASCTKPGSPTACCGPSEQAQLLDVGIGVTNLVAADDCDRRRADARRSCAPVPNGCAASCWRCGRAGSRCSE